MNAYELRKYFKAGDHVRVIGGRYEGDTGLIVRVEDKMVILLSDLTMGEVRWIFIIIFIEWNYSSFLLDFSQIEENESITYLQIILN